MKVRPEDEARQTKKAKKVDEMIYPVVRRMLKAGGGNL